MGKRRKAGRQSKGPEEELGWVVATGGVAMEPQDTDAPSQGELGQGRQ